MRYRFAGIAGPRIRKESIDPTRIRRAVRRRLLTPVCWLAVGTFALQLAATSTAQGQSRRQIDPIGQTPAQVSDGRAVLVDHYDPANMLRLAFVLTPTRIDEERQFLEDVQNKQSPLFHQFLTPEEWNARFAPAAEDEQAVVDWATTQGLTVTRRFDNRLVVDVEAPAGKIEKAFNITINHYRLQAEGDEEARIVFSNDHDPVLPSRLSSVVQSVLGLNSVVVMRPASGHGNLPPRPDYVPGPPVKALDSLERDASSQAAPRADNLAGSPEVTPPPAGYWTPEDLWSSDAYDYRALMNQGHCCNPTNVPKHSPASTSIAIMAFGDVSINDVSDFRDAFSYLAAKVQKIAVDGGYTCNPKGDDNCSEVTLDTEWSLATANSEGAEADTAEVFVYETSAGTAVNLLNTMVSDGNARTMSSSFGFSESSDPSVIAEMNAEDTVFSMMASEGWTLVSAAGDQGATGACSDAKLVIYPASDPNVVAAGGTELNEGSPYEVAWTGGTSPGSCAHNNGGGTGGFSIVYSAPGYQSFLKHSMRSTPDLSLDAYYGHDVYYHGGWQHPGGTSDVAPMLAGFFAQENAYLLYLGNKCGSGSAACAPIGNANYPIYREAQYRNAQHDPFYDITVGCNSNDITLKYGLSAWCAKPGYDETTGWGSANMLQLAWAINWYTATANGIPNITFTGPKTGQWYSTQQTVSWKVNDYAGTAKGAKGTGIAGHTQGWDSIPSDPGSEGHGGSGNSFYSGPQYVNDSGGCLSLQSGGSCKGGVSDGCHTVHVRGWNNQGMTTGDATYGPICYDGTAPSTRAITAPLSTGVEIRLEANDPGSSTGTGSGIRSTFYAIDNASCNPSAADGCRIYSGPLHLDSRGSHTIYFFSEDNAGNREKGQSLTFSVN